MIGGGAIVKGCGNFIVKQGGQYSIQLLVVVLVSLCSIASFAQTPVITVEGSTTTNTTQAVTSYRWLIEEDAMHHIEPGQTCKDSTQLTECLSVDFHRSYMPVIAEGHSSDPLPDLDPGKHYQLTILPDEGFSLGGTQINPGQTAVTVRVNQQPIPTAQIRVFVFNDNNPINNTPDQPQEVGLAGFTIELEDAGGRYGAAGQIIRTDAFGNPLGTTYNADGSVNVMGDGVIRTDANGYALIKNVAPAKYGIIAVPPTTDPDWIQTSTIEGKKIIDAWVKANEPGYFAEFGPPGPHVFIGFVKQFSDTAALNGSHIIEGDIRTIHNSRPPDYFFYTGPAVGGCWVGLNAMVGGVAGPGLYAGPCDANSHFSIPNVPDGTYSLSVWDENLGVIFAQQAVTVAGSDVNLLDVPVFTWFSRLEQHVFNDLNENGIWDDGEEGMPEVGTGIRWRDGTVYQGFPTDTTGAAPYDEVFPFFSWLVAEVAYDRFKATGVTVRVDAGGPVGDPTVPYGDLQNPQPQSENNGEGFRVETGPVLTQAFQGFMGQTNILEWGKTFYQPGENGGISGIVYYAITRAEDNPQYAAAELWEPGIPRIQMALYQDFDNNGEIDDINGVPGVQLADVDNYPFGNFPGPEDFNYSGDATPNLGDAIQVTTTDSWDDNLPTGCQGDPFLVDGVTPIDCYDGLRVFNQVRPGVFDGGYAFSDIPVGTYIVATGEHPVYKTVKEEDRNVDFGDTYAPAPNLLPPVCVGNLHTVPPAFSLFDSGDPPYRSGEQTPLCDQKQIILSDGKNAAADFFMFTDVPIAGHAVGFILDDASNEFDPTSPQFGEKYSPPYIPVSIRDWKGHEIGRTYSDRWGRFSVLIPSTYTVNLPTSSGMSPNMVTTCMNDPGPIPDPTSPTGFSTDPFFQPQYSQFCYTLQYMPGATTYLDTPVVPVAAFAGPDQFALDCAYPDGTPVIRTATGPGFSGPYVAAAGDILTITAVGTVDVPNPNYDGTAATPKTIPRDFGFGATPGTVSFNGIAVASGVSWSGDGLSISVPVPAGGGQLSITRADGVSTEAGITVTVGGPVITMAAGGSIQDAIDMANPGDLILIPEGTYEEMVIMDKPVKLQGAGAGTVINAVNAPAEKLQAWYDRIAAGLNATPQSTFDLLPGQELGFDLPEPVTLFTEAGAGVIVLGKSTGPQGNRFNQSNAARIDGITITGSDNGGGIVASGYANNLQISNNRIYSNYGVYGGGIRVGHPNLTNNGVNNDIKIHHNYVAGNGGNTGAGGGVSINWGSDNYQVTSNWICGNFTGGDGGGVAHYGLSENGLIANNKIIFNQSFQQGNPVAGGGVFVGGVPGLAGALTEGTGDVTIDANLIQGNNAGAGNGGGISLALVNGTDVTGFGNNSIGNWHRVNVLNNIVINNVAGYAGGGISMQDALRVNIVNNTVAHNDSTGTSGEAFDAGPNTSTPHTAGIVSFGHGPTLMTQIANVANTGSGGPTVRAANRARYGWFSNASMVNNIIFQNRSFFFTIDDTGALPVYGLVPNVGAGDPAVYDDMAVYGLSAGAPAGSMLTSSNSVFTGSTPNFLMPYFNEAPGQTINQPEATTSIQAQPAFDEGGNFISVRYGPLTLSGDYHVGAGSAVDAGSGAVLGTYPRLATDIDGDARPQGAGVDIGADESQ